MPSGRPDPLPQPAPEPRYTLEQARRLLLVEECVQHGHDFELLTRPASIARGDRFEDSGDAPVRVICRRCSRAWLVGPEVV